MTRLLENTVVVGPGMVGPVPLMAGTELPEWADGLVGPHLLDTPTESEKADQPDESWTVADLRDYAKAHDIDLEGATVKADILDAIKG